MSVEMQCIVGGIIGMLIGILLIPVQWWILETYDEWRFSRRLRKDHPYKPPPPSNWRYRREGDVDHFYKVKLDKPTE